MTYLHKGYVNQNKHTRHTLHRRLGFVSEKYVERIPGLACIVCEMYLTPPVELEVLSPFVSAKDARCCFTQHQVRWSRCQQIGGTFEGQKIQPTF